MLSKVLVRDITTRGLLVILFTITASPKPLYALMDVWYWGART